MIVGDNQLLASWEESFIGCGEGALLQLYIPPELAYGDKETKTNHVTIPPNSHLECFFEIKKVFTEDQEQDEKESQPYE